MLETTRTEQAVDDLEKALKLIEGAEDSLSDVYGACNEHSIRHITTELALTIYRLKRGFDR